jgi:pyruvate/2-oxoglutarate dehydrogenase complex dihydrolipoamide acyltransferase (E2) component
MPRHDLLLPDLGLAGRPVRAGLWLVARGSRVTEGDPMLEVVGGSLVVDLPAPVDGLLVDILVDEDQPLEVGQLLAVILSDENGA